MFFREDQLEGFLTFAGISMQEIAQAANQLEANGLEPKFINLPAVKILGLEIRFSDNCVKPEVAGFSPDYDGKIHVKTIGETGSEPEKNESI